MRGADAQDSIDSSEEVLFAGVHVAGRQSLFNASQKRDAARFKQQVTSSTVRYIDDTVYSKLFGL